MKKQLLSMFVVGILATQFNVSAQQSPLLASIIKIVSPVEVSDLIRKQGIKYDNSILNKAGNLISYKSDYQKAFNLGVFSTDLGYATINDQNMDALMYLNSVKKLAEDLKVSQFIDIKRIMNLASNKDDMNKLLDETSTTFENISNHLDKQSKSNLAAFMLTGGWLETLSITCEVAQKQPSQDLKNRIIEQKIILAQFLEVLNDYQAEPNVKELTTQLGELNTILNSYKMETVSNNATKQKNTIEVGGVAIEVVESDTKTEDANLTAQDLTKIAEKVRTIRAMIIK